MDVDFWAARVHSSKHLHALQPATTNYSANYRMVMEDEGEDEVRAWFPCPFCYVEIELPILCLHLQEEHCFDFKNAVCPICAANLGRDAIGHFIIQHAHSIKRRKKSQKSSCWSNVSSNIVSDFRELSSFHGTKSLTGVCHGNELAPDPILSPFLSTMRLVEPENHQKDESSTVAADSDSKSSTTSARNEVEVLDYEERRQQAAFLQGLLVSTIFLDF